jgi:hypothetical protein
MNRIVKLLGITLAVLSIFGCGLKAGLVRPQPFIRTMDPKVEKPLEVFLGPDIQDNVVAKSAGLKDLTVENFIASLKSGFEAAYTKNFSSVRFAEKKGKQPLLLVLEYANPSLVKVATIVVDKYGDQNYECKTKFKYAATLYCAGKKIKTVENEVASDESTSNIYGMESTFRSGIEAMLIDINKHLFSEDVLAKITK